MHVNNCSVMTPEKIPLIALNRHLIIQVVGGIKVTSGFYTFTFINAPCQ